MEPVRHSPPRTLPPTHRPLFDWLLNVLNTGFTMTLRLSDALTARALLTVCAVAALTACGGGGGGADTAPSGVVAGLESNTPAPVAASASAAASAPASAQALDVGTEHVPYVATTLESTNFSFANAGGNADAANAAANSTSPRTF